MPLRVLLDECLPKKLKQELAAHFVATVQEMGWSSKKNGELMMLARDQFDVFITADQNLQYQQNLAYADVGVIVLVAPNNRIETLKPLMPQVEQVLLTIKAGDVIQVEV
jgi:predicted nuclease of predicted toxin-antitoxin system